MRKTKHLDMKKYTGADITVQQVQLLLTMPTLQIAVLVQALAALLLIQLSANVPGKAVEEGRWPRYLTPVSYVGNPNGVPGSCLQHVPDLAVGAI